jgi:hypothetical protein
VAGSESVVAHSAHDWLHAAIEARAIEASTPYVGITEAEIVKLADSAFGERPLLIRLRTAHGDWRIVKCAKWLVAWNAAADPETIEGSHGASFRPIDIRDVFPVEHGAGSEQT